MSRGRLKNMIAYLHYQWRCLWGYGQAKDLFLEEKYYQISPYYGQTLLDIGSGYGRFADFLQQKNHRVCLLDIIDKSSSEHLKPVLFDGKQIPFEDKAFDSSIMMFILHHAKDQQALLREAARVTRNYIIIAEDVIENPLDRLMAYIHLWSSPLEQGKG